MSTSTEEVPVPGFTFRGADGNECEAFVVAIRDFAFATGRDGDHSWMLRFATTRLRGKALRWHASLDPSISNDWGLFVQALFNQYSSVEEDGVADVATPVWSATTFSPGPSTVALPPNPEADRNLTEHASVPLPRQYDASSTRRQIGLLRVVSVEGETVPQYLWWEYKRYHNFAISTTINRHEAPVVSFLPSSVPHVIGCWKSSSRNLALPWTDPKMEYYVMYGCPDDNVVTSTLEQNPSAYVAKAWNLLADGTLQATISCLLAFIQQRQQTLTSFAPFIPLLGWNLAFPRNSGYGWKEEAKFTTTEVHVNILGEGIRFVKPGALLEQDKPGSNPIHPFVRARIVFEPL